MSCPGGPIRWHPIEYILKSTRTGKCSTVHDSLCVLVMPANCIHQLTWKKFSIGRTAEEVEQTFVCSSFKLCRMQLFSSIGRVCTSGLSHRKHYHVVLPSNLRDLLLLPSIEELTTSHPCMPSYSSGNTCVLVSQHDNHFHVVWALIHDTIPFPAPGRWVDLVAAMDLIPAARTIQWAYPGSILKLVDGFCSGKQKDVS